MRYRVKEYWFGTNKLRREVYCHITVSDKVYSALEQAEEDGDLLRAVTEAVRLIADETQGGYVLMSTGQKNTLSNVQLRSDNDVMLTFSTTALIEAADGDEDDIAAINAMANTDVFTIEMDWGDEPSGLSGGDAAEQVKDFFGIVKDGDTVKVVTEDGGEEIVEPVGLMDEDDVYDYLEDIAVLMGGITAQQAASITAATRAIIHGGSGSGEGGEGGSGSGSGE